MDLDEPEIEETVTVIYNIHIVTEADQRSARDVALRRTIIEVSIPMLSSRIRLNDKGSFVSMADAYASLTMSFIQKTYTNCLETQTLLRLNPTVAMVGSESRCVELEPVRVFPRV